MTLGELLTHLGEQPYLLLSYYGLLPILAILLWIWAKDIGEKTPWKYIYSALIYLSCVPGVFAVALAVYLLFFENTSILSLDVWTILLPIVSMMITLIVIRRNVCFEDIPGFYRIGGLLVAIFAAFTVMYIAERMRIYVFSYLPFSQLLLIFGVLFLIIMLAIGAIFRSKKG